MIRSSSAGNFEFKLVGTTGAMSRMEWKTTADVSPLKGSVPVAIR